MKENFEFKTFRYIDNDGNPTCAFNFLKGEFCDFLMTSKFGTRYHCYFDVDRNNLEINKEGYGFIIPCKQCPLWNGENNGKSM